MLDFVRVACAVPPVTVGDPLKNARDHCAILEEADARNVDVLVFPELSLTGYTCQDLFFQDTLAETSLEGLGTVLRCSEAHPNVTVLLGLPVRQGARMFNCAAVLSGGKLHGLVPKTYIPNYNEFYEKRWFSSANDLRCDSADHLRRKTSAFRRTRCNWDYRSWAPGRGAFRRKERRRS